MADYGLRVYDSSGNLTLDVTDKITRLVFSEEDSAGDSSSHTDANIDGLSTIEIAVGVDTTFYKFPHKTTRSGTTISWEPSMTDSNSRADSVIFSFLYN